MAAGSRANRCNRSESEITKCPHKARTFPRAAGSRDRKGQTGLDSTPAGKRMLLVEFDRLGVYHCLIHELERHPKAFLSREQKKR
jgi:hypothetical protein